MTKEPREILAQEQADIDAWETWQAHLLKTRSDVGNLLLSRYIFQETQRVIGRKPKLEGIFVKWLRINYVTTMALGIRRQLDTDSKAVSLANLFRSLIAKPNVITRERLLSFVFYSTPVHRHRHRRSAAFRRWLEVENANLTFDDFAATDNAHMSREVVGRDLKLLQRKGMKVERFATKRLAHYDIVPPAPVRYKEIDDALDALDGLLAKYNRLIRPIREGRYDTWIAGAPLEDLYPDWKQVFEMHWTSQPVTLPGVLQKPLKRR
jgi:hypothetical protein